MIFSSKNEQNTIDKLDHQTVTIENQISVINKLHSELYEKMRLLRNLKSSLVLIVKIILNHLLLMAL